MKIFAHPHILWLLLLVVPLVAYYVWRTFAGGASIRISSTSGVRRAPRTWRYYVRHLPFVLRVAAVAAMVVALARPQIVSEEHTTTSEGIDIVVAMDISGSMLARDFRPDRLTAAKEVAAQFVANRQGDRIGLVVFAGESFTQTPLTTDQSTLQTLLGRLRSGIIDDGTAIGNGLATAVNRLRESGSKSKVVILLTDGVNNSGQIAPLTVADIAKSQKIKVYTIGIGRNGTAPFPVFDAHGNEVYTVDMKVEIDEKMLREIASKTGGEYFRATDKRSLESIYKQIDSMEKSKIENFDVTLVNEEYLLYVLVALALLLTEFIVKYVVLKRIP